MVRRVVFFVMALGFASLLMGCGPRWQVVHQTTPSPLVNQRSFAVLPIEYSGLRVGEKTEAQYLSEKDAKQQESFQADKDALNQNFARALIEGAAGDAINVALATGPSAAPFEIRPVVTFIEPGFYAVVASMPSEVHMTLRITLPNGQVIDEITLAHSTDSRSGFSVGGISMNPSSGGRLRKDGEGLGEIVAKYLRERVGG
ncbi:hypothetical protein [Chondromyces crocatus]|uniref:Lipoprotein n=1 Tax=Chondromyces crocatus TaxID=52 RepID=A0A0K1ETP4_CHOCO|nr:hypothetical protein [Chondromyces crocatus]AKT44003.1 uncharacterized protein CMC5_082410 [Chondromyces crocatus]